EAVHPQHLDAGAGVDGVDRQHGQQRHEDRRTPGGGGHRYLTDSLRGTVRMYAESARSKVARIPKAVTARSFSTTVSADRAVTPVSQGDASSSRRNRVKAWMSTVRPSMSTSVRRTGTAPPAVS